MGGIKWKLNDANELIEDSVHYECQKCKGRIEYKQKTVLNRSGKWIPTAKPIRPQYRSYSFNALCIPAGFDSWITIVYQWILACPKNKPVNIDLLKTFTNTRLGELWEDRGVAPRVNALMENVRDYEIGIIPDLTCEKEYNGKIALITLSCDLAGVMDIANKDEDVRLDWELVAHTSMGQTYSINHGSIGTFQRNRDVKRNKDDVERKNIHLILVWKILFGQILRK